MLLQTGSPREVLSTGDALESLLLEMDNLVVGPHVGKLAEDLVAGRVFAGKLHTQMHLAVVILHTMPRSEKLGARGAHAWNLNLNRLRLVATLIFLATNSQMLVQVMLRGEGCVAE